MRQRPPVGFLVVFNQNGRQHYYTSVNNVYKLTYVNIPAITINFLGTLSNVLLLVAFLRDPLKCFRNSATYLVANLAISDCATCLISLSLHFILTKFGREFTLEFCYHWFVTVSCVSIASISIDRFLMIAYPIKHRILMEGRVMILWMAVIYIHTYIHKILFKHASPNNKMLVSMGGVWTDLQNT